MAYKPAPKTNAVSVQTNDLVGLIQKFEPQIKAALPKHITPERMTRIVMTEVRKNPQLAECDKASFFGAVIQCAQLGLEPGTGLGHAYLLPYRNKGSMECQLIIGYQGMIDLAERSGKVTIDAHVIYEKDEFSFTLGLEPSINHVPYFGDGDRGHVKGAYAVARYADGRSKFRVLSRADIDAARDASKSGKSNYSPWASHYDEMARKTAIRRLFKMLPKSPESLMATVERLESSVDVDESQDLDNVFEADVKQELSAEKTEVPKEILEG
jgi:recombination protein RecT